MQSIIKTDRIVAVTASRLQKHETLVAMKRDKPKFYTKERVFIRRFCSRPEPPLLLLLLQFLLLLQCSNDEPEWYHVILSCDLPRQAEKNMVLVVV